MNWFMINFTVIRYYSRNKVMFTCWFTGYIKRVIFVILHKPELKLWFVSKSSIPMYWISALIVLLKKPLKNHLISPNLSFLLCKMWMIVFCMLFWYCKCKNFVEDWMNVRKHCVIYECLLTIEFFAMFSVEHHFSDFFYPYK